MSSYIDDPTLILATHVFVKEYMSKFDSSHDYAHVLRVLTLAEQIHAATLKLSPFKPPDHTITVLTALLHDVGDKKYAHPSPPIDSPPSAHSPSSPRSRSRSDSPPSALGRAEEFLISAGCDPARAALVQLLVSNVSYSHEQANPDAVAELCALHPELPIVQDADRLDAIGAVGIGRAFTYGAAKRTRGGMDAVMGHFDDKLVKLQKGMKTVEGIRLAKDRGERIRLFMGWWREEMRGVNEAPV